ncbi:rhodanese-like domain-containing protein [Crenobacter sp. SG2305]|uniref:sulfurtransferase n=1 Tax=Crenobacter oryzisoli TaxID=3056844 RepID=UPI0025AB542A|nr:rhodanese-like domain-containing protein [Crenobacter sp. SG2305]MDN0084945.1 rhodanese-like domain-containing protein [Crenobacter sp. SG2305]
MRGFCLLLIGLTATGSALALELPGPLVNAAWLAQHGRDVQIIDIRSNTKSFASQPVYETDPKTGQKVLVTPGGHIPGALLVDFQIIRTDRKIGNLVVKFMNPEKAEFEKLMQAAGVVANKPIILVPVGENASDVEQATRLYWQFKYYGEKNLAVLDGGLAGWFKEGRAVSNAVNAPAKGNWVSTGENKDLLAESEDVARAVKDERAQLVDARDLPQFYGLVKRADVKGYGHIPGARPFPPDVQVKTEGGVAKFLPPAAYKAIFAESGIRISGPAITYCNTGHLGSGAWFVMSEILRIPQVRLYDGSMIEWTLENRPAVSVPER